MTDPTPEVVRALAPTGTLRAALNLGNPVLVQRGPDGTPSGTTVDLARELARRLGVPVAFLEYDGAGKVSDAAESGVWDVAFMAIDPLRAEGIEFTPPYVLIEGTYVVPAASPLQAVESIDQPGTRVAVGDASAYHLFMARALRHASIVTAPTGDDAAALFLHGGADVLAGVKQPNDTLVRDTPGLRAVPGRFMSIRQAMCVPHGRGAGAAYVRAFIAEMAGSGFVARALAASGQDPGLVAPNAAGAAG